MLVQGFFPIKQSMMFKHVIDVWATCTNIKRLLSNLGHEGVSHQDFKAFSPVAMMTFNGFAIINGLAPSPRFECEFKTLEEDPVAGNYLCDRTFGDNASRQGKYFKLCFSLVDFRLTPPS